MIPRFYVVFTGIQLHPHFHWLCTYLKYEKCPSLHVLQLRSYLGSYKPRALRYVTDGIQVYELCEPPTFFSKLFAYCSSLGGRPHTFFTLPRIPLNPIKRTSSFLPFSILPILYVRYVHWHNPNSLPSVYLPEELIHKI